MSRACMAKGRSLGLCNFVHYLSAGVSAVVKSSDLEESSIVDDVMDDVSPLKLAAVEMTDKKADSMPVDKEELALKDVQLSNDSLQFSGDDDCFDGDFSDDWSVDDKMGEADEEAADVANPFKENLKTLTESLAPPTPGAAPAASSSPQTAPPAGGSPPVGGSPSELSFKQAINVQSSPAAREPLPNPSRINLLPPSPAPKLQQTPPPPPLTPSRLQQVAQPDVVKVDPPPPTSDKEAVLPAPEAAPAESPLTDLARMAAYVAVGDLMRQSSGGSHLSPPVLTATTSQQPPPNLPTTTTPTFRPDVVEKIPLNEAVVIRVHRPTEDTIVKILNHEGWPYVGLQFLPAGA